MPSAVRGSESTSCRAFGAQNAGILAAQMLAVGDPAIAAKLKEFKESLKHKIVQANEELKAVSYKYKTN